MHNKNIFLFLFKSLFFIPLIFLIIGINYYVDPAFLFSNNDYEYKISKLLAEGNNVANISNYDERLLQKFYIQLIDKAPDIIVLGSSRSMQIRTELFPRKSLFNHSVSGASLEDIIAIYSMYIEKNTPLPKTVIIGLDPWLLNINNNQGRWKAIKRSYYKLANSLNIKLDSSIPIHANKYLQLVSLSYFQESLKTVYKNIFTKGKKRGNYFKVNTDKMIPNETMKRSDGSFLYDKKLRSVTTKEVEKSALKYINEKRIYSLEKFTKLNHNKKINLSKLILFILKKDSNIIFFLPPYHPTVYNYLDKSEKYKIINEAEAYFIRLAKKHKIPILGSYNPNKLNLTKRNFYDGMHPKENALKIIFSKTTLSEETNIHSNSVPHHNLVSQKKE